MFETGPRSQRLLVAAGIVVAGALVIDTLVWAIACRRLDARARNAAAGAGWLLSTGVTGWGGWPAVAEVTLPGAALRAGPEMPPLSWTISRATLRLSVWHPTSLTVEASGGQTFSLGEAAAVPFTAGSLVATVDLMGRDPVRVTASDVAVAAPDGPVRVAAAALIVLPDGLSADLAGLTFAGRTGQPITPAIDGLRADARVTPPIEALATASESARRWRANEGTVEFSGVSLRWGALDATAHATLRLDESLQPAVDGRVTATGLAAVIEQSAQSGALTRSTATAAEAMLTILSAPFGRGPVTLPVTLQDGVVSIARIPLLRLAPVRWD